MMTHLWHKSFMADIREAARSDVSGVFSLVRRQLIMLWRPNQSPIWSLWPKTLLLIMIHRWYKQNTREALVNPHALHPKTTSLNSEYIDMHCNFCQYRVDIYEKVSRQIVCRKHIGIYLLDPLGKRKTVSLSCIPARWESGYFLSFPKLHSQ